LLELVKSELPPSGEMEENVGAGAGKDLARPSEQHVPEEEQV
jgi:hypothetical protein